jgi:hypothetical protein
MEMKGLELPQNPRENDTVTKKRTLARTVDASDLGQWLEKSLLNCPADADTQERIRQAVLSIIAPAPVESATAQP